MARKKVLSTMTYQKLNIEFANNGYILRNPYDEDDLTLVLNEEMCYSIGKEITDTIGEEVKSAYFPVRFVTIEMKITLKDRQ